LDSYWDCLHPFRLVLMINSIKLRPRYHDGNRNIGRCPTICLFFGVLLHGNVLYTWMCAYHDTSREYKSWAGDLSQLRNLMLLSSIGTEKGDCCFRESLDSSSDVEDLHAFSINFFQTVTIDMKNMISRKQKN
jgi:hypothetical protein